MLICLTSIHCMLSVQFMIFQNWEFFRKTIVRLLQKFSANQTLKPSNLTSFLVTEKKQAYGYSVQIYFGAGSDAQTKAEKSVKEFRRSFPDEDATIVYEAPYFKVHAGNCRSRLEATKLKKAVESQFPGCFIVECKINYPKL